MREQLEYRPNGLKAEFEAGQKAIGAIIDKTLGRLERGQGQIAVLVMLE